MIKLSISTLGCPDWTLSEILNNVSSYGYDAIELRGIGEDLDLWNAWAFSNPANIAQTRVDFANAGLDICAIDSSASLAAGDAVGRRAQIEHGKRTIELAVMLNVPFVRVFGGNRNEDLSPEDANSVVVAALQELGEYAADSGGDVTVVLETHDAYSTGASVAKVLKQVASPDVAALWDLHHPYRQGETPEETYAALKTLVRMTHVKDSKPGGTYCLLGEGDIPVKSMLALLKHGHYDGYLSLEWEKRWLPDLLPPEIAFPQYVHKLRQYLSEV